MEILIEERGHNQDKNYCHKSCFVLYCHAIKLNSHNPLRLLTSSHFPRITEAGVLDCPRAKVSKEDLIAWFDQVYSNILGKGVDLKTCNPNIIWNVDESGFQMSGMLCVLCCPTRDEQ